MKICKKLMIIISIFLLAIVGVSGQEISTKNLEDLFYEVDFYTESGSKYIGEGSYIDNEGFKKKVYIEKDKIFVPIKIAIRKNWILNYDEKKSEEIVLKSLTGDKKIKLTVGNKEALVNDVPLNLIDPIKRVDGTMVASTQTIKQLLDTYIYYEEGVLIVANEPIDLKSNTSKIVVGKVKRILTDKRNQKESYKKVITKYNNKVYYLEQIYNEKTSQYDEGLYIREEGKGIRRVELPGITRIYDMIDEKHIGFVSSVGEKRGLYSYAIDSGKIELICPLTEQMGWAAGDGWLESIKKHNDEYYMRLHVGDLTMGGEYIYRISKGKLIEIAGMKSLGDWLFEGNKLYYTDFRYGWSDADNLYEVDLKTNQSRNIGEKGFAYDIYRVRNSESESESIAGSFYIKDNTVYTLGYLEEDKESVSSVYAINLEDNSQQKLTVGASRFWIVDDTIYYQDSTLGYLVRCDLDGGNKKTLIRQNLKEVEFHGGNIYYTIVAKPDKVGVDTIQPGIYKYNIATGNRVKVSKHMTEDIMINESGIYYIAGGYESGIYKMTASGNVCLVDDWIGAYKDTGKVILYTGTYIDGAYSVK